MSNLLNGTGPATPDYMQGVGEDTSFGEGMDGGGFPRLAFKGSRFRLRQGDEETVLKETELGVIILRDYPAISRLYFESGYDPDGNGRPVCASADGEVPIPTAAKPQSDQCATCPQNEKGSTITDDGRKSRACSFYKRLILLVKGYEEVGPVVCDIKAMSLFGDSKPNDDLWTLKSYFRRLTSNNVKPFQVWTELSFDIDASVPKVFFRAQQWVDETVFTDEITPLIGTVEGREQLTEMADTSKVRTGESEDGGSAMQDRLLASDKPAHLEAPAEEEAPTKEEAAPKPAKTKVTKKKVAKKVAAKKPEPEPEPEVEDTGTKASPADEELDQALLTSDSNQKGVATATPFIPDQGIPINLKDYVEWQ